MLQTLEVVYSYWDGSGHRRSIEIKKSTSIGKFLELVKQQLVTEFTDLRMLSADNLMYVKEDLIIPHVRKDCFLCFFCFRRVLILVFFQFSYYSILVFTI